jgi:hypothetical protein
VKFEVRSFGNFKPPPFPLVSPVFPDLQAVEVLLC